jgi:hypothetical protein
MGAGLLCAFATTTSNVGQVALIGIYSTIQGLGLLALAFIAVV